jgi:hypothetical protein
MARLSKLSWVAAPVAFFTIYRLALHLHHLPDRRALIAKYGSAAFYDGQLFGLAGYVTMWYAITLVVLVLILPQITFIRALLVGGTTALLALAIASALGRLAGSHLPFVVAMYGPIVTSALIMVLVVRWLAHRAQAPIAAAV